MQQPGAHHRSVSHSCPWLSLPALQLCMAAHHASFALQQVHPSSRPAALLPPECFVRNSRTLSSSHSSRVCLSDPASRDVANFHKKTPSSAAQRPAAVGPLLPELSQLGHLKRLLMVRYAAPPWGNIPPEWLAPGAFPRLKE